MPTAAALRQELRFTHMASGARIAWARSGHGPPLLRTGHWMTHVEYDTESALFQPWLERLGRAVTLYRYDERGCGLSGADATLPSLESSVQEISAVADAAGLKRMALLGISGGAAPSIAYAARYPDRVSHLLLLGGYSHGLMHRNPSAEQRAYIEAQTKLIELGWGVRNSPVQQFISATMLPDGTPEQVAALNEQQRRSCGGVQAAAIFRSRLALDVRDEIAQVRCPTLVLHAEGDAAVNVERGRELAAAITGARFESLRSRNHVPLAGEPAFERFCEAVTAFVTPHAVGAGGDKGDTAGVAGVAGAGKAFTPRERELLMLVARGCDNLQIAAHLGLADKTVRNALSGLYAKLGVDGRTHAVVRARELGYS